MEKKPKRNKMKLPDVVKDSSLHQGDKIAVITDKAKLEPDHEKSKPKEELFKPLTSAEIRLRARLKAAGVKQ